MKDFNRHDKPGTEIRQVLDQEKHYKLFARMRLKRGLKLWQYDIEKDEVTEITPVRKVAIGIDGKEKKSSRVDWKEGHLYTQALNKDNAVKKFVKMIADIMGLKKVAPGG